MGVHFNSQIFETISRDIIFICLFFLSKNSVQVLGRFQQAHWFNISSASRKFDNTKKKKITNGINCLSYTAMRSNGDFSSRLWSNYITWKRKYLAISHISHPRYQIWQYIQDSLNSSHQNLTRLNYLSCFEYWFPLYSSIFLEFNNNCLI